MKVLLATSGSRGDVQPMLALALAFQREGHDVLLAGPPERAAWARALGCAYAPLGADATALIDSMGAAHTLAAAPTFLRYLKNEIDAQFRRLPDLAAGRELVIGASLCFALSSIAERGRIPYRFIAFTPQLLPSGEHPFMAFRNHRRPAWFNRLGWDAARMLDRFHMNAVINRHRRRIGLPGVRDWFRHAQGHELVVASDAAIAPLPTDIDRPAVQTGYMHLRQPEAAMCALERFLAAGPAPVYVGFGSMPRPDQARLQPLVTAAGRAAGQRLVVARFWNVAAEADGDVFFISRYPHRQLFPRMAAVVHHGGAGTTATAAICGVPQLIVPHILDQYYWGERIRRTGIGPAPVWRSRLSVRRLAAAIDACVSQAGYRNRAERVGRQIRSSDGAAAAVRQILTGLE
ncbi:MAG: glycosyltransferase [Pseudomonadota bacterium]